MYPTHGEVADRVRAAYIGENATRENSKRIIEEIAAREGITTAKVRHILTYGGPGYVRWTKENRVWSDDGTIRSAFLEFSEIARTSDWRSKRSKLVARLSDELSSTQKSIEVFAKAEGYWPIADEEKEERPVAQKVSMRDQVETAAKAPRPQIRTEVSKHKSNTGRNIALFLVAAIILCISYGVIQSIKFTKSPAAAPPDIVEAATPKSNSRGDRTPSSSGATSAGTATDDERRHYSEDLYDKPTGLTAEQTRRYEGLSKEGQEAVDRQMELYDRLCAKPADC